VSPLLARLIFPLPLAFITYRSSVQPRY